MGRIFTIGEGMSNEGSTEIDQCRCHKADGKTQPDGIEVPLFL